MDDTELTDTQKKFLEECEEEFKDRFTERDSEFMKVKMMNLKKPPIAYPWYSKDRRQFYQSNQDRKRERNSSWDRHYNDRKKRFCHKHTSY